MKKRAFTLTELLVVVVIVGVLSAVVLPKFTKVLQTRKTTEAENVMAAVRNEQEARCMVGRDYVGQEGINKLASLPKATSKNYTYSLDKQGITATAKDGEYILQIPSYTDGRICCSEKVAGNGACDALNKDYPKCDATFLANIDQATCEAPEVTEIPEPEPEPEPEPVLPECTVPASTTQTKTETCGCTSKGTKTGTRTFDEESCAWGDWSWSGCSEKETECEEGENECKQDYCSGDKFVYHLSSWYEGKKWVNDKTECCERIEACPETCEDGLFRVPNVNYTHEGKCCRRSCDDFCTGRGVAAISRVSRPCDLYNMQLQRDTPDRQFNYTQTGTRYYDDDPSVCYRCTTYPGAKDLKDAKGNVLVKGWDAATCSYSKGKCPEGYDVQVGNVCYKVVEKQAVAGISMQNYLAEPGSGAVYYYDGGYKQITGGGLVRVVGYNARYGVDLSRCEDGKLAEMCKMGGKCVKDWSKVPHYPHDWSATYTSDFTQCIGDESLSVLNTARNKCALGQVVTGVTIKMCE